MIPQLRHPLSLALLATTASAALTLDTKSPTSIKDVSSTLASAIIANYRANQTRGANPGTFSDHLEPYAWDQNAAFFNSLISYSHLTNDTQYNDLVTEALKHQMGENEAPFMPLNQTARMGNDDHAAWALAALTAAEAGWSDPVPNKSWLKIAQEVFDVLTLRWNSTSCGGGLNWQIYSFSPGYSYKSAITNGAFFLLAARLGAATGNETYSEWAEKGFKWTQEVGLIDETWAVNDGTDDREKCSQMNHIQWTAPFGFYTEGAAVMYNLTNGADEWKAAVTGFANHTSVFISKDNSALIESACEERGNCNVDQRHYKGLIARSLHRASIAAPFISGELEETLTASGEQAAKVCNGEGEDMACGFKWSGEEEEEIPQLSDDGLGEVFNALEAVQGLLYKQQGIGSKLNGTNPSGNATGTPTESGGAPESTGAAGKMSVALGSVMVAAVLAVAGLA